jgi:condensin-2 complex subunit G2
MFEALTNILQSKASCFSEIYGLEPPLCPVASTKRKKGKSLKKTPARSDDVAGNKSSTSILNNEELAAVGGASWQINEILKAEEMRAAFLQSYAEIAFSSLKVISQVYIEQCLHFESLDLTPVLAYLSLATHSALQDVDQTDIGCSEVS